MKPIRFIVFILFVCNALYCSAAAGGPGGRATTTGSVYVCTGNYSNAYHYRSRCPGLNNCGGEVVWVSVFTAENFYHRTPCCICFPEASNCTDDQHQDYTEEEMSKRVARAERLSQRPNYIYKSDVASSSMTKGSRSGQSSTMRTVYVPYYVAVPYYYGYNNSYSYSYHGTGYRSNSSVGGYYSEAYVFVAAVLVAAAVVVISNDIYVYPTMLPHHIMDNQESLWGVEFGLRKTFDHCAIEYGVFYDNEHGFGAKLGFTHEFFYNHTPDRLRPYAGVTASIGQHYNGYLTNGYGLGAVVGCQYRLFDRLKVDLRYELSTTTSQLMLGLIFKYQKKYLWE